MPYPEKNATYKHKPKFIDRMKRAEGGRAPQPTDLYDLDQLEKIEAQEKRFNPPSERFDLLSEDGLSGAKQKLDSIGLGRAVTLGPSVKEKE